MLGAKASGSKGDEGEFEGSKQRAQTSREARIDLGGERDGSFDKDQGWKGQQIGAPEEGCRWFKGSRFIWGQAVRAAERGEAAAL